MDKNDLNLQSRSAKEKYPQTRQLTILETVSNPTGSTPRQVGVSYVPIHLEPCAVLKGKWLREAGFNIGQKVTITVTDNRIVIVPATVSEAEGAKWAS